MYHHEIEGTPELSFSAISLDEDQRCMSLSRLSSSMHLAAPSPLRRCRSASPATGRQLCLSIEQQKIIKQSWNRIPKAQFGRAVLNTFINTEGVGHNIFVDRDTKERHVRQIVDLVQSCVEHLDNLQTGVKPWLDLIGRGHANFRITGKHWENFAEALVTTASEWNGPGRRHKETGKAWLIMTSFLADRLAHASRQSHHSPMLTPRVQLMSYNGRSAFEFNT
ncbi:CBN-GLB-28 protein [Caenorhabditis brenneri]|uniref:CBN-GLB-28 protein n=1 Tax=Caenorhabditis brenneri TaxID=135651 RepID=G0MAY0_CAEBE|nr:CBN-GLB-28 protein [Caenorhabditis brenneri]